jgi:tetratricopeptide (TPR) repeat protein
LAAWPFRNFSIFAFHIFLEIVEETGYRSSQALIEQNTYRGMAAMGLRVGTIAALAAFAAAYQTSHCSEISEALALKEEAMDVFRTHAGKPVEPALYAEAIKKLQKAEDLLEEAKKADPVKADALESEVLTARFWAQKFSTVQVSDVLNGKAPAPVPSSTPSATDKVASAESPKSSSPVNAPAPVPATQNGDLKEEAAALMKDGKFAQARMKLQEYLASLDKNLTENETDKISTVAKLRDFFFDDGNYAIAETYAKRIVDTMEKRVGRNDPILSMDLNKLAETYCKMGRWKDSESIYRRVLTLQEGFLGRDHLDVASTLANIGTALLNQDKPNAESFIKRAFDLRSSKLKPDSPQLASSIIDYCNLYHAIWKYPDELPKLKQAIAILEKNYGQLHASLIRPINRMGAIMNWLGHNAEGEQLLQRAMDIAEKTSGPDHPVTASVCCLLSIGCMDQNKFDEAHRYCARALKIQTERLGIGHEEYAYSLYLRGKIYLSQGDYDKAIADIKGAIDIMVRATGTVTDYGEPYMFMGRAYKQKKNYGEAENQFRQGVRVAEGLGIKNAIAFAYSQFADMYWEQNKYSDALTIYLKCVDLCQSAVAPNYRGIAWYMDCGANCYKRLNRNAEAAQLQEKAKQMREKSQ